VTRDLCGFQGEKGWIALNAPEFVDWSASEEKGRFRQRRPDQPVVTLPTTASRSTGCDASDRGIQINWLWRFRLRRPDQPVVTLPTAASRSTAKDQLSKRFLPSHICFFGYQFRYFSFSAHMQCKHIKSIILTSLLCFPKNLAPWRDSNPGLLVPKRVRCPLHHAFKHQGF
jgi:hypothetical protein